MILAHYLESRSLVEEEREKEEKKRENIFLYRLF